MRFGYLVGVVGGVGVPVGLTIMVIVGRVKSRVRLRRTARQGLPDLQPLCQAPAMLEVFVVIMRGGRVVAPELLKLSVTVATGMR